MKEIVLNNKKNGMAVLLLTILLYLAATALMILGGIFGFDKGHGWGVAMFVLGIVWLCVGWIPLPGLKVLKPQEALVLTLFGKYIGTLKEEGFYFVNPFCVAVNPAAKTKLNQSGDVDGGGSGATTTLNALLAGSAGSWRGSWPSGKSYCWASPWSDRPR